MGDATAHLVATLATALAAKDNVLAAKDEALAAERKAKDDALAAERKAKDDALAAERKAKDDALAAKDEALAAERTAKDAALAEKRKLEMELQQDRPRLERLCLRFALEHAGNCARKEANNQQLTLTDALMSYCSRTDPAADRVYQVVRRDAPELPHRTVFSAFKALVDSCHQAHHEVLREVTLQHPEVVFHNDTQRRAFLAICELVDLPVLPGMPTAAAAAGAAEG